MAKPEYLRLHEVVDFLGGEAAFKAKCARAGYAPDAADKLFRGLVDIDVTVHNHMPDVEARAVEAVRSLNAKIAAMGWLS